MELDPKKSWGSYSFKEKELIAKFLGFKVEKSSDRPRGYLEKSVMKTRRDEQMQSQYEEFASKYQDKPYPLEAKRSKWKMLSRDEKEHACVPRPSRCLIAADWRALVADLSCGGLSGTGSATANRRGISI